MKKVLVGSAMALMLVGLSACQSKSQEGVTSNYHSQWTKVNADVRSTTSAAEAELNAAGLKGVTSSATGVDGKATGKKADGTKVDVAVKREGDTASQVSVTVGTLGDPTLGAQIAHSIKNRAEGGTPSSGVNR